MPASGAFVPVPQPDPAAVYAQAPPLAAEVEWFHSRLVEGIQATESRPDDRIDLLRWAALADRLVEAAHEQVEAYGRDRGPAAVGAWDALLDTQWDLEGAHQVLEAYDAAHGTRLGSHVTGDYGLMLVGACGYIRQEYAAWTAMGCPASRSHKRRGSG